MSVSPLHLSPCLSLLYQLANVASVAVFFATILPALVLAQIEPQYIMSRMTFAVSHTFFTFLKNLHVAP